MNFMVGVGYNMAIDKRMFVQFKILASRRLSIESTSVSSKDLDLQPNFCSFSELISFSSSTSVNLSTRNMMI